MTFFLYSLQNALNVGWGLVTLAAIAALVVGAIYVFVALKGGA